MQAVNKVREWQDALDAMIAKQPKDNYLYRHRDRETPESSGKSIERELPFMPSNITMVNERYIASPEYAQRFSGITGINQVDSVIAEQAKEILLHRSGSTKEDLILVDAKTGNIIHALKTSNVNFGVAYDGATQKAI